MRFQIGATGIIEVGPQVNYPTYFDAIFCRVKVPEQTYYPCYYWTGFTDDKGFFFQIGLYSQAPNQQLINSPRLGPSYVVGFSHRETGYVILVSPTKTIEVGDELLLIISRDKDLGWIGDVFNETRPQPKFDFVAKRTGFFHLRPFGEYFHISSVRLVMEGYGEGDVDPTRPSGKIVPFVFKNITVRSMATKEFMPIPRLWSHNPQGWQGDAGGRAFLAPLPELGVTARKTETGTHEIAIRNGGTGERIWNRRLI